MGANRRLGAVFVSGLLLGAAAVAKVRKRQSPPSVPLPDVQKARGLPPQPAAAQVEIEFPRTLPEFEFAPVEPMPVVLPAQAIAPKPRYLVIFASLFVVMAVALVGAWMGFGPASLSLDDRFSGVKSTSEPIASAGLPLAACQLQPAIAAVGDKDGQFPVQTDVSGLTAADVGSFLVIGRQSAQAGRPRDAEVAFLMACRVADKIKGTSSVESADARYQLGTHYRVLAMAAATAPGLSQADLLQRAEALYTNSLPAYLAKYGKSGDKSKQAGEGLSAVRLALEQPSPFPNARPVVDNSAVQSSATGSIDPVTRADEAASATSLPPVTQPEPRKLKIAKAASETRSVSQALNASRNAGPSFDCRRSRSNTEKMICSDAELARLDRELGRAYGRARNATADPAAFRRQSDMEWRRRETICQDRDCLLRWYDNRRAQLVSVIDGRQPVPPGELR